MTLISLAAAEKRDRSKRTPRPIVEGTAPTEDGVALEFAQRYEGRLLYDHDLGCWFVWTGSHWRREKTNLAFEWVRVTARDMAADVPKASSRIGMLKSAFSNGVEKFARSARVFAATADKWNRDPFLLGTPDGTVDLKTGVLRDPEPADLITKTAAVAPAAEATCPIWIRFLCEATNGDEAVIRFLRQLAGYSLTADVREHTLTFLWGPGGNGKSVLVNVLTAIMRDYAVVASMDTFTASVGDKHPTELASLHGARFVTASETEEGRAWAESRIKQLTGGDRISARFMRQDFFEFDPTFKLFIVGNHRPSLRNVDDALRRRLNFIAFTHKPETVDPLLEEKLRAEWPGILRWMIDGCLDWQANGLVRPAAVAQATDSYFSDQDVLGQWLEEECDTEPGNVYKSSTSADLFASWRAYSINAGEKPMSQKSFADALQKRGFERHKGGKGIRSFRGIRVKQTARQGEDQ